MYNIMDVSQDNRNKHKKHINNKLNARDIANVKINKLNDMDDHNKNLERLFMERGNLFGNDSKNNSNNDSKNNSNNDSKNDFENGFGEITGNDLNDDNDNLRGLPLRSQYNIKKLIHNANDKLNFNLFDDKPSNLKVDYYDPSCANDTTFSKITESMSKISNQVHPINICSEKINKINDNTFYYLYNVIQNKSYVINGISIFNLFASLYLISDGMTEVDVQKFFNFPKKEILNDGMGEINNLLNKCKSSINIKNFMFVGNDVPCNLILKKLIMIKINNVDLYAEYIKINNMINEMFDEKIRNPITIDNLLNLQLMFLIVSVIHPIWSHSWDEISFDLFNGVNEMKQINFMKRYNKSTGFYENDNYQLLELKCDNDDLVMGFLNTKCDSFDINDNELCFMIDHLKNTTLNEIAIPMFKQDLKLRLNNTIKNMGLKSVFINIYSSQVFPQGVMLQDIIQNIKIIVDDKFIASKYIRANNKSPKKIIFNHPFIFYFRLVKTNTILLQGFYQ